MRTIYARSAGVMAALVLAILLLPGLALAHERRAIGDGKYNAVVGWRDEPAYQNQINGAGFRITRVSDNQPVAGLEKTLTLKIAFGGGQPKDFTLEPVFNDPGFYVANIQPTKAGSYIWTLGGTIEGVAVNETFESGPGRFDDIEASTAIQFPVAQADPSAAITSADAARADAASARTFAIAGIVVGGLGLLAALAALMMARRPATSGRVAGETRA